jgi:hypothetical protein
MVCQNNLPSPSTLAVSEILAPADEHAASPDVSINCFSVLLLVDHPKNRTLSEKNWVICLSQLQNATGCL